MAEERSWKGAVPELRVVLDEVRAERDQALAERDRLKAAYHEELESMFGTDFADRRIAFLLDTAAAIREKP